MRIVISLLMLFFTAHRLQAQTSKPNIVFILSDDLSFRDLSCYGQTEFKTPNIDQLAQVATRFTQAYAAAPECAPSRGCLLTGLHMGHAPIRANSSARGEEFIPKESLTFPKILKQQGYTTAVIGKWGLGYRDTEGSPLKQGFDYHFGYYSHYEAHSYFPFKLYENDVEVNYEGNKTFDMSLLYDKERKPGGFNYESMYNANGKFTYLDPQKRTYAPDMLDEKALGFIDKNKTKPFFLYFTTPLPHGPPIVDDFRQLANRKDMGIASREWGAMVERLDISVGKIIQKLKEQGLYDNTIIIFASDNGYAMHNSKTVDGKRIWLDDPFLKNKGPFHGGKFTVREAGMRIPFFIKSTKQTESKTVGTPVWLIDLYPTLAAISGYKKPLKTDGYNLEKILRGVRTIFQTNDLCIFLKTMNKPSGGAVGMVSETILRMHCNYTYWKKTKRVKEIW